MIASKILARSGMFPPHLARLPCGGQKIVRTLANWKPDGSISAYVAANLRENDLLKKSCLVELPLSHRQIIKVSLESSFKCRVWLLDSGLRCPPRDYRKPQPADFRLTTTAHGHFTPIACCCWHPNITRTYDGSSSLDLTILRDSEGIIKWKTRTPYSCPCQCFEPPRVHHLRLPLGNLGPRSLMLWLRHSCLAYYHPVAAEMISSASLYVSLILIFLTLCYARFSTATRSSRFHGSNAREAAMAPYWLPWLGHSLSLLTNADRFIGGIRFVPRPGVTDLALMPETARNQRAAICSH